MIEANDAEGAGGINETILMFEQILEVMPDDEMALRTLYDAYTNEGEREKAFSMLGRLTVVVLSSGELDLVAFLIDQYHELADLAGDQSGVLLQQLEHRLGAEQDVGREVQETVQDIPLTSVKMTHVGEDDRKDAELALAWNLFQDGLLPQDDYSQVLQDLTEMSSKSVEVPVTVLHVLSDRSFSHFSTVVTYMCKQTGTPFVSLLNFEISDDVLTVFPFDFVIHNAAICFKVIGNELLIAVLNPLDKKLLCAISDMTGRKCHIYLIVPEEYDEILNRVKELRSTST